MPLAIKLKRGGKMKKSSAKNGYIGLISKKIKEDKEKMEKQKKFLKKLVSPKIMDILVDEYSYYFFECRRSRRQFLDGIKIDCANKEFFYSYFGM